MTQLLKGLLVMKMQKEQTMVSISASRH